LDPEKDIYDDDESTDHRKISHDDEGKPIFAEELGFENIDNYLDVN
jgi:hypothetical protein